MSIERHGSAAWSGGLKDGRGSVSTQSGALDGKPYGFAMRFEGEKGANPEELIAAAHASCFTMALSMVLGNEGLTAEKLETKATVTLDEKDGGFAVTKIHLSLIGTVPGADEAKFNECAETAKANCPISKLMNAEITLETKFA